MYVFSDIAGTIVQGDPWKLIRQHPAVPKERQRSLIIGFLPIYMARKIGVISDTVFRDRWLKTMARLFEGMSRGGMQQIFEDVITREMVDLYHQDVIVRLQEHRRAQRRVVLVSGMFRDMSTIFARYVDVDDAIGTRLIWDGDICTGQIDGETCVGPRKIEAIRHYIASQGFQVEMNDCYGFADSYSDRVLLTTVGYGVATYPDDQLRQLAQKKGWEIID